MPLDQLGLLDTEPTADPTGGPTADPAVAAALAPLAAATDLPLAEQLAVYARAHHALQAALDAEIS
jgi:hypothetical protein